MTRLQELRHPVVLLKRRVEEQADGSFIESWQEGDTLWAKITPCEGREILGEGWNRLMPVYSKYKVTLRSQPEHFQRLKWEDRVLVLLGSPLHDNHRQWMSCFMYEWEKDNE